MRTRPAHDVIALLARCAVGVVFLVHGWQKVEDGVNTTAASFDAMGVPLAKAAAVYATFVELLGGAALIAGLGLPLVGTLLFLDMAGAFAFVHYGRNLTGPEGSELVLVLAAASLLFAAGAGGRLTVDHALSVHRRRTAELAEDFPLPPDTDETPGGGPHPGPAAPPAVSPAESTAAGGKTAAVPAASPAGSASGGDTVPELPLPAPGDVMVAGQASGDVPVARSRRKKPS
ncbi:DoxX family protein [Actinocorallia populi]|uniref:DoxX family protein n=1 Tax=Actinocorallia populi TaxID=2079200 RepID=UPI0018E575BE|nr:DoxX family protein [Actinocorallia populi]